MWSVYMPDSKYVDTVFKLVLYACISYEFDDQPDE